MSSPRVPRRNGAPGETTQPTRKIDNAIPLTNLDNTVWWHPKAEVGVSDNGANFTERVIIKCPATEFVGFECVLAHNDANVNKPTLGAVLATTVDDLSTLRNRLNPSQGNTLTEDMTTGFQTVTFGGVSPGVFPDNDPLPNSPAFLVSDYMSVSSKPPKDGSTHPAITIQTFIAQNQQTLFVQNFKTYNGTAAGQADKMTYCQAYKSQGNFSAAPQNFESGGSFGSSGATRVVAVRFRTKRKWIKVMHLGDSITMGAVDNANSDYFGMYQIMEEQLRQEGMPVNFINWGWGGLAPYQFQPAGIAALDLIKPNILFYSVYSPNGGMDDVLYNSYQRYAEEIAKKCAEKGILCVYVFYAPLNGSTPNGDFLRKKLIQWAKDSGVPTLDVTGVTGKGDSPETYKTGYSVDGVHPNFKAYTEMAVPGVEFLRNLIHANFDYSLEAP